MAASLSQRVATRRPVEEPLDLVTVVHPRNAKRLFGSMGLMAINS
ncbi:hypothetical protein ACVILK_003287 [Bradyrhizobium embrapense]